MDRLSRWMRIIVLSFALLLGCNNENGPTASKISPVFPTTANPYLNAEGPNVLSVRVGGSTLCGQDGNVNQLCTSLTLCEPGTSRCQVISDVLLDTGSVGLRVFSSILTLSLVRTINSSGQIIAECAQFGTGSDWGPLAMADIRLAGEAPVTIPIQLIDKSFATPSAECLQADTSPQQAGYNGILGVGLFNEDCGALCAIDPSVRAYFGCMGSSCEPIVYLPSLQIQNPVAHLATNNNGLLVALPQVKLGGVISAEGVVIFGIGTQLNNAPVGVTAYSVDSQGNFVTLLNGKSLDGSFIDSGSNGLYFLNILNLPLCSESGPAAGFYCPQSTQAFSAINLSAGGNGQTDVSFYLSNAERLAAGDSAVFSDLGGVGVGSLIGFDWGLPFFFGRAVFHGIQGKSSALGQGLYIAY